MTPRSQGSPKIIQGDIRVKYYACAKIIFQVLFEGAITACM
jgi:hypothetical protein